MIRMAIIVNKAVPVVIMVLLSVWFMLIFNISSKAFPFNNFVFSLTRSNITIVSLIEKPIIVRNAATAVRSI